MARRTLFPILLIMILLILLTTRSIPSAASAGPTQSEGESQPLTQESGLSTGLENEAGGSPSQPRTAISSGGSGLYLKK